MKQFVQNRYLYKSVQATEIIFVEDVFFQHSYLIQLTFPYQLVPPTMDSELIERKDIFVCQPLPYIFSWAAASNRTFWNRTGPSEQQDALVTKHCNKCAEDYPLQNQRLVIMAVSFWIALCPAIRPPGLRGLAQLVSGYILYST